MKKINLIWIALVFIALFAVGCSKIQSGYITDKLVYLRNPQIVSAGVLTTSILPELNGTSQPIHFFIAAAYDSLGIPTDMLTKNVDLVVWNEPYNLTADTSIALVNAKRKTIQMPITQLNERSGQFTFTPASNLAPKGKYSFDVRMENVAGSQVFKDAMVIDIQQVLYSTGRCDINIMDITNFGGGYITAPSATVNRIERKPTDQSPNTISFKIVDKYGKPWNPKAGEIVPRGDRPSFPSFDRFSKQVNTDSTMTWAYPFAPFPLGTDASTYNAYDVFYRVLMAHVAIDGSVPANGAPCLPGKWNMNVTFGFRFLYDGDWEVTIHIGNAKRI